MLVWYCWTVSACEPRKVGKVVDGFDDYMVDLQFSNKRLVAGDFCFDGLL